jgi:hypothetical protein
LGQCNANNDFGYGVYGRGGSIGVCGLANNTGGTTHYGGYFMGSGSTTYAYPAYLTPRLIFGKCGHVTGSFLASYEGDSKSSRETVCPAYFHMLPMVKDDMAVEFD